MVISPDRKDFSTICNIIGRLFVVLSAFLLVPLAVALLKQEVSPFFDYLISFLLSASLGFLLLIIFSVQKELNWIHAFFSVSLGWLLMSLLAGVPLYLSSHAVSFIDAWFESMSGLATTGLVLMQDLDHLAYAHNMWRHLTMFIGGQGIILAGLSVLTWVRGGAVGLYVVEGRQEKIFPNVIDTARFIWKVSIIYLVIGTGVLTVILYAQGLSLDKSVFHAMWLFFAAFDTGGFGPQAQNIGYYHCCSLEIATMILMMLGAINFNLHYWIWTKSKKELLKNFEMRIFLFTLFLFTLLIYFALKNMDNLSLFRQGFFQIISAHTGCGFTNLATNEINGFSPLAILAIIFAMMVGGGVCSTSGGIKLMRLGLVFKTIFSEIKRCMMPFKAVYQDHIHHLQDLPLSGERIKDAYIFFTIFLFTYVAGGIVGIILGYDPLAALFESVSATANVGLSMGITVPSMPVLLKIVYILQMWMGRLEFLSIFVSIGFVLSLFKK